MGTSRMIEVTAYYQFKKSELERKKLEALSKKLEERDKKQRAWINKHLKETSEEITLGGNPGKFTWADVLKRYNIKQMKKVDSWKTRND